MRIIANGVQKYKGDFADFGYNSNDSYRNSWKRLSFGKFPLQPIRLSVLKLDGSSFDIIVTKKATVAKLKQAVEAAFYHLPREGNGKVSWSHVWGQFCLCFEGQKLLRDRDSIGIYGIQNGDQLQFIRHISVRNVARERSEKLDYSSDESDRSVSKSGLCEDTKKKVENEEHEGYGDLGANSKRQFSWVDVMRGLFSYGRLEEDPQKGNKKKPDFE